MIARLPRSGPERHRIALLALDRARHAGVPMVEAIRQVRLAEEQAPIDAQRAVLCRAAQPAAVSALAIPDLDDEPDHRPWWQRGSME